MTSPQRGAAEPFRKPLRWPAIALLALVAAACATSPTGRRQFMIVSPQTAIAESAVAYLDAVRRLEAENKLLDDPAAADRIAEIAGRVVGEVVAQYPHTANWQWSVALVDEPDTANAWCMAGGRMAVYSGLMETLDLSDAELAHILGHEAAHAIANHPAERMSIVLATQTGLMAAAANDEDTVILMGAALAAELAIALPNSRASEAEADLMGMELATRAGYDPAAAVSMWTKLQASGEASIPEFLNTHPSTENRRETLAGLIPQMSRLTPEFRRDPYPVEIIAAD